ncbi:MAG: hypothetical protein KBT33_13015 [Prevotellaceae bacterium]|nr:hypothetical protein [Candidatus Minthosoma equi]
MKAYLTYALNQKGDLVHINSVPNGNDCGCICPHCKSELCAKNGGTGEKMVHHFAHLSGADCVGAIESALHKMAKDVMKDALCIQLPDRLDGRKGELLKLDRVEVEFYDKDTHLRPDCIGYYGDKIIWIEFKRTHAVDTKKRGKIISAKIDCVELDINVCPLDPDAVRKFITEESDNRIWIRDTKTKPRHAGSGSRYSSDYDDYCDYYGYRHIQRVFALDENGALVNLLSDEFDMNTHSYYCVACGKELTIDVDAAGTYSFAHIDEGVHCEDDLYLHEAAKEILHWRFNSKDEFEILVPQKQYCAEKFNCNLFLKELCSTSKIVPYNLKDYGYNECAKNFLLPDFKYKCDLVIKKKDSLKDAIIITIDAGNCHVDVDTEDYRVIEFRVRNDFSLLKLIDSPIGERATFNKQFYRENSKSIPRTEMDREVLKFSLFSSGKYYIDEISCTKFNEHKFSTVLEYVFVDGINIKDEAKRYSLLKCYEQKRKACYCEICWFLVKTSGFYGMSETICKRYKTKGTPHYPLVTMPLDCPYFSIDKDLVSFAQLNYGNVKLIENRFE